MTDGKAVCVLQTHSRGPNADLSFSQWPSVITLPLPRRGHRAPPTHLRWRLQKLVSELEDCVRDVPMAAILPMQTTNTRAAFFLNLWQDILLQLNLWELLVGHKSCWLSSKFKSTWSDQGSSLFRFVGSKLFPFCHSASSTILIVHGRILTFFYRAANPDKTLYLVCQWTPHIV